MSKAYENLSAFFKDENIEFYSAVKAEDTPLLYGKALPDSAKSVVVFLIPYYTGKHENRNISLYSISLDYHLYLKELAARFKGDGTDFYRFFADASPINERELALKCGLGVLGENGLVINQKYGSYIFIGSVITSAEFDGSEYSSIRESHYCAMCGRCKRHCDYLSEKSKVCISELNQRKTVTEEELNIIKSKKVRWGCDECQEICPMNAHAKETPVSFFYENLLEILTPEVLQNMPKSDFQKRAYSWRGKNTILRNIQ